MKNKALNDPDAKGRTLNRKIELEPAWLEDLRGPTPNAAFARLYQACLDWVLRDRGSLVEDECLDIVSDSLLEELNALLSQGWEPDDVAARLEQSLKRNLLHRKRSAKRFREYNKLQRALASCGGPEDSFKAEHLIEIARFLKGFIGIAIEALPDREYTLLYRIYHLERFGFKSRAGVSLSALSPKTRQATIFQARASFLTELNRLLDAAGSVLDYDRRIVDEALRFVRSNRLSMVLAADHEPQT